MESHYHDYEIEEIQSEFKRKKLLETILGPSISLIIHVVAFVALLLLFVSQTIEDETDPTIIKIKPKPVEAPIEEPVDIPKLDSNSDPSNEAEPSDSPIDEPMIDIQTPVDTDPLPSDLLITENALSIINKPVSAPTNFLAGRNNKSSAAPAAVNSAINKGLAWLASRQRQDGNFFHGGAHPNAIWGATTLAFLGNGNTTTKGKYKDIVKKSITHIIAAQKKSGPYKGSVGWHSFATPFVVMAILDAAALDPEDKILRQGAQDALDYVLRTQQNNGGWSGGSRFAPKDAKTVDITATAWWTMSLISGRLAGFKVPDKSFEKIDQLLKDILTKKFTGELIVTRHGGENSTFNETHSLSALALTLTQFLGHDPKSPYVKLALKNLAKYRPDFEKANYWTLYKQGIGSFQLGRDSQVWERFAIDYIGQFIASQNADGSWDNNKSYPHRGTHHGGTKSYWGKEGATAMAILNLQVYFRYGSIHDMYARHGRIISQKGVSQKTPAQKAVAVQQKEIKLEFLELY